MSLIKKFKTTVYFHFLLLTLIFFFDAFRARPKNEKNKIKKTFQVWHKQKITTSVRVELTILRLTVARLNQLGHEVMFLF